MPRCKLALGVMMAWAFVEGWCWWLEASGRRIHGSRSKSVTVASDAHPPVAARLCYMDVDDKCAHVRSDTSLPRRTMNHPTFYDKPLWCAPVSCINVATPDMYRCGPAFSTLRPATHSQPIKVILFRNLDFVQPQ